MVTFRSDPMKHGTLVIPSDRGHEFIDLLGRKCIIEFMDMNAASMRRQYKRYIQRIEEMERVLRFLFDEIQKLQGAHIEVNKSEAFLEHDETYQLDVVENSLQKLYSQFVKFRDNNVDLSKQKSSAIEEKAVVKAATSSLVPGIQSQGGGADEYTEQGLLEAEVEGGRSAMGFSNLAGVILQRDQEKFSRTLFRVTRGNTFTHFDAIDEPMGDDEPKSVVVIYFQGSQNSALFEKIHKICQAFGVSTYPWPRSHSEAMERIARLDEIILDKGKALQAYEDFFLQEISVLLEVNRAGGNALIEEWRMFCVKEKAIYATLNKFEGADVTLRGDCWFPASEEDIIRQLLQSHSNNLQASAFLLTDRPGKTRGMPPTYFRTTEFTAAYQGFVDTYGIASYREANPALLTIVTFPYLFGIMYGDIGHGGLIALFGLFLLFSYGKAKNASDEMVRMLYGGRYMILMMGCFGTFAGFLYNDFFSLGVDIFGSRYVHKTNTIEWIADDKGDRQFPYPFGFDPIWKGAENELVFFNSFKMKFSVIVAFFQMGTGIMLKLLNSLYFHDWPTLVFEFFPQIVFFFSLVGYMDFLIFLKWIQPMSRPKPSIITTLINMFMLTAPTEDEKFFNGQATVQKVLVLLMLICIPLMLLPKPFILRAQAKKKAAQKPSKEEEVISLTEEGGQAGSSQVRAGGGGGGGHDDEEEFSFGECFIHQMIETIEFVLGAISNTASYLRLWALSLAHQQLALVFFNITVLAVLKQDMAWYVIGILLFFVFAIFAGITFAVMLCMDTLECFLHALRLQWVEFQNKFFKAAGHKFVPFQFSRILSHADED